MILGTAYSKFNQINGPGGGTSLSGAELKTEATKEMEDLEKALLNFEDGSTPMWFVIG